MNNLPSTYGNLIKKLEDRLDHTTDPLTMSVLRDEQFEKYEKIRKRRGCKSNKSDDSHIDTYLHCPNYIRMTLLLDLHKT